MKMRVICYKSRVKQLNPLTTYVVCAGHSLKLVGSPVMIQLASFVLNNSFEIMTQH